MRTTGRRIIFAGIMFLFLLIAVSVRVPAETKHMTCVVHRGEWVWIRAAPTPDGEKTGKLRFGYEVDVDMIREGYAHITWTGESGWVDCSYLLESVPEAIYVVTCDGGLNCRETPGGRYVGKIKSGARVSVLGWRYSKDGDLWAYVYGGKYCMAKYLAPASN